MCRRAQAGCWLILIALAASGCGERPDSPVTAEPTPKVTVVLRDDAYHPAKVRVPVGSRVTWVTEDIGTNYTVETGGVGFFVYDRRKLDAKNVFDLHTVSLGEADSVEFDTPGRYVYHSSFDGEMRGVVEVVDKEGDG